MVSRLQNCEVSVIIPVDLDSARYFEKEPRIAGLFFLYTWSEVVEPRGIEPLLADLDSARPPRGDPMNAPDIFDVIKRT